MSPCTTYSPQSTWSRNVLSLQHQLEPHFHVLRGIRVNILLTPRGQGAPSGVGTNPQKPLEKCMPCM